MTYILKNEPPERGCEEVAYICDVCHETFMKHCQPTPLVTPPKLSPEAGAAEKKIGAIKNYFEELENILNRDLDGECRRLVDIVLREGK